jgi:hypothetical protein
MTVLIYVTTSKQVGDADHLKVVRKSRRRGKIGSKKTTRNASRSNRRCSRDLPAVSYKQRFFISRSQPTL